MNNQAGPVPPEPTTDESRRAFVLGSAATTSALALLPTRTLAQLAARPKTLYWSFP